MRPPSLRDRSIRAFVVYGALLLLVYAVFVYVALQRHEDRVELRHLEELTEESLAEWRRGEEPSAEDAARIYVGAGSLPEPLRRRVEDLPEGNHEIHLGTRLSNANEYFVAVRRRVAREPVFVVYHPASALEDADFWRIPIVTILGSGLLLVVIVGAWWGRRLADRLAAPLAELARIVGSTPEARPDPAELADTLRARSFRGEVGLLADALAESLERIEGFVERERHFTRNASHELRSPVTASRGALELLEAQLAGDEKAASRLARIERSLDHMEEIIEAFLWLAREEGTEPTGRCDLATLARSVAEDLHPADASDVRLEVATESAAVVQAPESLLRIVISNLLLNALQHTEQGRVKLAVEGTRVTIEDSGPGIPEEDVDDVRRPFVTRRRGGRGLGLAIVGEICERFGWHLEIGRCSTGTRITVDVS